MSGSDSPLAADETPTPRMEGDDPQSVMAAKFKEEGNAFFKAKRFDDAIEAYAKGLESKESAILLANRAFAYIKTEGFGFAIEDATRAIELEPTYSKGYYRRGSALVAMGKPKKALKDFRTVVKMNPRSKDARNKFNECQKAVKRLAFEEAIATERTLPPSETVKIDDIVVEETYDGPQLPSDGTVTMDFVRQLMEYQRAQKLLHRKHVMRILVTLVRRLKELPSLVDVAVPESNEDGEGGFITVCGDTHGQYYDLLNVFDMNGLPSEHNPYVFNGDYVDRGSFSVENVLLLFALKLALPGHMHLTRGNHETINMNKIYGFEGEVKHKYDDTIMALFTEAFQWLPIAVCVGRKVLVVHGGLPQEDNVSLDQIRAIKRGSEPADTGLMSDLLWSDPHPFPGRHPSKRGVGQAFGPDITKAFLDYNNLDLLIRSHEVKPEGYVVEHNSKCVTVFSAPNYCDQMGNKGAFVKLDRECKPMYVPYEAVEHPPIKPMAYAQAMNSAFGLGM